MNKNKNTNVSSHSLWENPSVPSCANNITLTGTAASGTTFPSLGATIGINGPSAGSDWGNTWENSNVQHNQLEYNISFVVTENGNLTNTKTIPGISLNFLPIEGRIIAMEKEDGTVKDYKVIGVKHNIIRNSFRNNVKHFVYLTAISDYSGMDLTKMFGDK